MNWESQRATALTNCQTWFLRANAAQTQKGTSTSAGAVGGVHSLLRNASIRERYSVRIIKRSIENDRLPLVRLAQQASSRSYSRCHRMARLRAPHDFDCHVWSPLLLQVGAGPSRQRVRNVEEASSLSPRQKYTSKKCRMPSKQSVACDKGLVCFFFFVLDLVFRSCYLLRFSTYAILRIRSVSSFIAL